MAVTRLERKLKRDRSKSKRKIATIKRLNAQPPIKNIDIEAIKAEFEKNLASAKKAPEKKETPKAEAPKEAEAKVEQVEEAPAKAPAKEKEAKKEVKAEKKAAPKSKKTTTAKKEDKG